MTTIVNVKVKNIRPTYYTLYDWMQNPQHEYIGRGGIVFINKERFPKKASTWANPFKVTTEGRDKCLELYETWVRDKIKKEGTEELKKLKNKVLGCWCKPEKCHGDILIKILNEIEE
jgi:hypothetical protein